MRSPHDLPHGTRLSPHVPRAWYDVVMCGEIRWTEDSETHIARHNITPHEVEQALYTPPPPRGARPGEHH